jgi:hypothetical protein
MKLTQEQIEFLNGVCYGIWTLNSEGKIDVDGNVIMMGLSLFEIPVKFGKVDGSFHCVNSNLKTLKNCPDFVGGEHFHIGYNLLTEYFKNLKEEDFPHWDKLDWANILFEYPFLVNIAKKYVKNKNLKDFVNIYPLTKLYLK